MAAALTTYYQDRYNSFVSLNDIALADFTAASDDLKSALASYQLAVDAGAELDSSIAAKRAEMSAASKMPSDVETLAEELRQLLIDRRHNTATIANAAEDFKFAEIAVTTTETRLAELDSLLTQSAAGLAAAQQRETQHDSWVSSEIEDDITVVRDLATALLAENPITVADGETNPADVLAAATARIDGDIPEVLLARARARAALAAGKLTEFQTYRASIDNDLFSHGASSSGSSGLLAQRWAEYEATESDLRNYALNSVNQYDLALNLLTSIGASQDLTQAESDRITEQTLAVDADEITTEATLHDARAAVAAQKLTVELAIVAARVADVNAVPTADPGVISAQDDLATMETDLASAEAAHTEEFASAIDLWEGAIPDAIWANLQAYDSAIGILTALSTSNASTLTTAFTNTEDALVIAAIADDNNIKLDQTLAAASTMANMNTEYISSVRQAVGLSAMRGDY